MVSAKAGVTARATAAAREAGGRAAMALSRREEPERNWAWEFRGKKETRGSARNRAKPAPGKRGHFYFPFEERQGGCRKRARGLT